MANLCFVNMNITAPKAEITKLYQELEIACNNTYHEKNWLGNLWLHLGYTFQDIINGTYGNCRGSICDFTLSAPNKITIDLDCSWQPRFKPIKDFLNQYAPKAKIEFEAEEPGFNLFTTSKTNINTVRVDIIDDVPENETYLLDWEGLHYKNTLHKNISKILHKNNTIEALASEFENEHPCIAFRFFEHADFNDYC